MAEEMNPRQVSGILRLKRPYLESTRLFVNYHLPAYLRTFYLKQEQAWQHHCGD